MHVLYMWREGCGTCIRGVGRGEKKEEREKKAGWFWGEWEERMRPVTCGNHPYPICLHFIIFLISITSHTSSAPFHLLIKVLQLLWAWRKQRETGRKSGFLKDPAGDSELQCHWSERELCIRSLFIFASHVSPQQIFSFDYSLLECSHVPPSASPLMASDLPLDAAWFLAAESWERLSLTRAHLGEDWPVCLPTTA